MMIDGERASFPRTLHERQPHHVTSFLMANASNIVTVFDNFRAEIDDHNDRRERLIKVALCYLLDFSSNAYSVSSGESRYHKLGQENNLPAPSTCPGR